MYDEQKDDGEIYLRKAFQCTASPSTYIVLEGEDGFYYLVRLIRIGEFIRLETLMLGGKVVSSSNYDEMLSFRQGIRQVQLLLSYIPCVITNHF